MKNLIKKILKESDFDWIKNIPAFIEITEPMTQSNPKNVYRLNWTNGHGEDYGFWADNWYQFKTDTNSISKLVRYIKILSTGVDNNDQLDLDRLVELYFSGDHDYIVQDWMKPRLDELPPETDDDYETILEINKYDLKDMLGEDLFDLGLITHDDSTIERWAVTYFDKHGVEFKTKINL